MTDHRCYAHNLNIFTCIIFLNLSFDAIPYGNVSDAATNYHP